uniref:Uncharacterized protein n=1 Tax=Anguilla anguilla TaxID=7936 RepID=A0A0E9TDH2_ANGAN
MGFILSAEETRHGLISEHLVPSVCRNTTELLPNSICFSLVKK